jgi:hypothetical protein
VVVDPGHRVHEHVWCLVVRPLGQAARDPIGPYICRNRPRPPASSRPIAIGSALSPQAKVSGSLERTASRAPYRRAYEGRECAVLTGVVRASRRCSFCRAQAQGPCEIVRGERPERWRVPEECVVSGDKHKLAFCTTGPDKHWTRDERPGPRRATRRPPRARRPRRGAARRPVDPKIRMTGSRRARRSPLLPWPCALAPARRRRWRAPNRRPSRVRSDSRRLRALLRR